MTVVVDSGPLVTLTDRVDPRWAAVDRLLRTESGPLLIPAPITAEVDYLAGSRVGRVARSAFLEDLAAGRFLVECLEPEEYGTLARLDRMYADLDPGLAALSIVVLAHRFRTRRVVTFDERHFRAIKPLQGGSFVILPADG